MEGKYSTYYNSHKDAAKPKKEITIYATDYKEGTIDGTSFVNNVSEITAEQAAVIAPALEEITQNQATATTESRHSSKKIPISRQITTQR